MFRSPLLLQSERSAVIIVDVQEKLLPAISDSDAVLRKLALLVKGSKLLNLPQLFTEQYPRGLGPTIRELMVDNASANNGGCSGSRLLRGEKTMFSCRSCEAEIDAIRSEGIDQLILAGIETHVCVAQSAMDLMANGFNVTICVDATGSRKALDRDVALTRMANNGVSLSTVEAVLFELCVDASSESFKQLLESIKAT